MRAVDLDTRLAAPQKIPVKEDTQEGKRAFLGEEEEGGGGEEANTREGGEEKNEGERRRRGSKVFSSKGLLPWGSGFISKSHPMSELDVTDRHCMRIRRVCGIQFRKSDGNSSVFNRVGIQQGGSVSGEHRRFQEVGTSMFQRSQLRHRTLADRRTHAFSRGGHKHVSEISTGTRR